MKVTFVFTLILVLMGAMMASARQGCFCPEVFDPVCGVNGMTYGNSCKAGCAGVRVKHTGACGGGSVS